MICYDGYKQDMSAKNRRSSYSNQEHKSLEAAAAFGTQMYNMLNEDNEDTADQPDHIHAHQIMFDDEHIQPASKKQKTNIHERIKLAKQAMKQDHQQDQQATFNTAYQAMAKYSNKQ